MHISYRRKRDGAYVFQHLGSKTMIWLQKPKKEFVLLSLNEPSYAQRRTALATTLIAGMLEQGEFQEKVEDVEIVETATIEFQSLDQQPPGKRGP